MNNKFIFYGESITTEARRQKFRNGGDFADANKYMFISSKSSIECDTTPFIIVSSRNGKLLIVIPTYENVNVFFEDFRINSMSDVQRTRFQFR